MTLYSIAFPEINPVIISFGPLSINWYSLSYVAGILLGWFYAGYIIEKFSLNFAKKWREDFITYLIIGIIVGGRLGHVLLYDPMKYLLHPIDILKTYEGGMAFHGALIGTIIAAYLFCYQRKVSFLFLTDLLAISAPIGLFLGRIANFINAELYGRVTDVPWAVVFPDSDMLPRHPSQIYEALLEGLFLFVLMWYLTFYWKSFRLKGFNSGLFLICYSISRIFIEFFREPDFLIGFLTAGQVLSLPMLILGLYLIYRKEIDGSRFKN